MIKWRKACFQNIYIAPLLVAEPSPPHDIWLFTNLAWQDYAQEYVELYGGMWKRSLEALSCLRRLWNDPEMQTDLERWLEIGRELKKLSEFVQIREDKVAENRWRQLIAGCHRFHPARTNPDPVVFPKFLLSSSQQTVGRTSQG